MIETERLILIPLTYEQLIKYLKCDNSLEEDLKILPSNRKIPQELILAFEETILPKVANNNRNYLYTTLWAAIAKEEQKMIGDFCIVGEPNKNGEIEIGYGVYDEFQNRGYMTEIVSRLIEWAKTQPKVKSIIAATEKNNIASFKVLEKNKFQQITQSETIIHWRYKLIK